MFAGRLIVVLLLAGLFANWSAPRRLQSLAAPVHAEAAVKRPPEGSSVLSTVIVVFGALGTIAAQCSLTEHNDIGCTIELFRKSQHRNRRTLHVQSRSG